MSAQTEHDNIEKIKKLVDDMEELDKQYEDKRNEISKLLLKRYPSSERSVIDVFKSELNMMRRRRNHDDLRRLIVDDTFVVVMPRWIR